MKKIIAIAVAIFCFFGASAQTYTWSGYAPIVAAHTDTIRITVSGLPAAINSSFGISKVCFDVYHTDKSNLILLLVAPNGNSVILTEGQGSRGNDFVGTCLGMDGVPFALGTPPYTGTFLPSGDISNFNNNQNPNGTWLLLASDISNPDTGSVRLASITFSNNPPSGNGFGGSNLGPSGPFIRPGIVCPGGASGCDLLPDVTASAYEIQNNHYETPGFLYVSNGTPNIGYGPLEIFGIDSCFCNGVPSPCNVACPGNGELKHIVRQRIYRKKPGTDTLGFYDRDAGAMTFHPQHGHLHVDDWADFTLRSATSDPDPRNWPILGTSVKQSYCLINLGTCAGKPGECVNNNGNTLLTVPNNGFGFYSGCGLNQGIYPGSYDAYSTSLNEPIPLQGICNGNYYIVSITDPENKFLESDETNNWVAVPVTLTMQNPPPVISANRSAFLCQGDSVILTSSQAPNYIWSTGDTSRSIVVKTAGNYTVSSSCGTSSISSPVFTVSAVPAGAKATVSIAITAGSNPSCAGIPVVFTATTSYGGDAPSYQWKINEQTVGTNSPTYTSAALTNGQVVSCILTSSISCLAAVTDTSNTVSVGINSIGGIPTLSIGIIKGANPQCQGDTAVFKATTANVTNVTYQWKVDGINVGTNSDTFSTKSLTNGQKITCSITSIPVCPAKYTLGNGSTSNTTNAVAGAAYPTYYGNGRQQYLVLAQELIAMGIAPGNITSLSFRTGGTSGDPLVLKGYTIKLASTTATQLTTTFLSPSFITVAGPVNYTPALNSVNTHFFTTPYYWDGSSNIVIDICFSNQVFGNASYQTYLTNTSFISTAYYRADNAPGADACTRPTASATGSVRPNMTFGTNEFINLVSDSIKMSVNSANTPSVSVTITAGSSQQCAGSTTTFTAAPDDTGANPTYQWIKNGADIPGARAKTYTISGLVQNDTIMCRMASGITCGILQNINSNKIGIDILLPLYTFNGMGNWNVSTNWQNSKMPPAKLLSCSEIIINPSGSGECILNVLQTIAPGAKLTLMNGKKFRVLGNMLIRQ